MNEPGDLGIADSLDSFFNAFADLANGPSSGPNRELVRAAAGGLVQQLRRLDASLAQETQDALSSLRSAVDQVNTLANRIADLNVRILASGGGGYPSPDLLDQRDLVLDQLSGFAAVRVLERPDGTVGVMLGDTLLVDAGTVTPLEVRARVGGGFDVGVLGQARIVDPQAGSLTALTDLLNTRLPDLQRQLDELAQALVTEVNALHRTGYTIAGATNTDFFDPAGVTARTIALSAGIAASADNIAAGATTAPGDGDIALQLAALSRVAIGSLGGRTLREHFTTMAGSLGSAVQRASDDSQAQQALVDHADDMRSSIGGVSVDEEMAVLISQQQAYQAAARLIRVAEEMMDDLMSLL
jgi:flagellar hook-associated protein 1 FlgK